MTDRPTTARVLLVLQAENERLRELLDAKSHEAGLYARRMEQAQRSRDEATREERAAVVAYLRSEPFVMEFRSKRNLGRRLADVAADLIEDGEHRREEKP